MSIKNHVDYKKEFTNLNYTIDYMKTFYKQTLKTQAFIDSQVEYGISHYNSDNAEQFNDLVINSSLQKSIKRKVLNITKGIDNPYFARINFTEENTENLQELYIGKMSLIRDSDMKFLIVDWRAPVSTLYYEGRLGDANYDCPDGDIKGILSLKRQYTIENGTLKDYMDIDITTNDSFLQASLGASVDNRLKDIVTTIQAEQNRVIRSPLWKPLIVQGAAGGGKTTIALHRIAYLLYNYQTEIKPENFLIIAPNRFFLSYISDVLPELGVENVKQSTFEDFAFTFLDKKFNLIPTYEKLSTLINHKEDISYIHTLRDISTFKSSIDFLKLLEDYMKNIENNFLPNEDFKIQSITLISYNRLQDLFLNEYANYPYTKRMQEIKKYLINSIKNKKNYIIEKITYMFDKKLYEMKDKMDDCEKRRELIIRLLDKRDSVINNIQKHSKSVVREYMLKIKPLSFLEYYKNFLTSLSLNEVYLSECKNSLLKSLVEHSIKVINSNKLEIEDLAPLMYIQYLVHGVQDKIDIKHVVIDEAQDFSLFQIFALKKIINRNAFTILGDICQGIYSYKGINNWSDVSRYIFENKKVEYLTLEQSYRTTVEIMDAAKKVIGALSIPDLPPIKPVIRHGKEVSIKELSSFETIAKEIISELNSMPKKKFSSAAVICKTLQECEILYRILCDLGYHINFITGNEDEFTGGKVLIPSYLVKGLEFDMVIIANASSDNFAYDDLDTKLLYVAMTRPLHELHIYSNGSISTLLKNSTKN